METGVFNDIRGTVNIVVVTGMLEVQPPFA